MAHLRRTFLAPCRAVLTMLVVGALIGCSAQSSAEKLSDDSPLFLATSPAGVTIHNRTGLALTDVSMTIMLYGPLQFSARLNRLENQERREISVNQFRTSDGTAFNARFHKAKGASVRARDTAGKAYEIEVPWD